MVRTPSTKINATGVPPHRAVEPPPSRIPHLGGVGLGEGFVLYSGTGDETDRAPITGPHGLV